MIEINILSLMTIFSFNAITALYFLVTGVGILWRSQNCVFHPYRKERMTRRVIYCEGVISILLYITKTLQTFTKQVFLISRNSGDL